MTVEVARHEALTQQFDTVHLGFDAASAVVVAPLSPEATYTIDDARRLLFTLNAADTSSDGSSIPDAVTPLAKNDAALIVLNARYHLTHEWDLLIETRYLEARDAGLPAHRAACDDWSGLQLWQLFR